MMMKVIMIFRINNNNKKRILIFVKIYKENLQINLIFKEMIIILCSKKFDKFFFK